MVEPRKKNLHLKLVSNYYEDNGMNLMEMLGGGVDHREKAEHFFAVSHHFCKETNRFPINDDDDETNIANTVAKLRQLADQIEADPKQFNGLFVVACGENKDDPEHSLHQRVITKLNNFSALAVAHYVECWKQKAKDGADELMICKVVNGKYPEGVYLNEDGSPVEEPKAAQATGTDN